MRVALIADVHGNAPALQAVLEDARKQEADQLWFLGDVLGYGPLPVSCIYQLDEWEPPVWLMGNHDLAALLKWDNPAKVSATILQLTPDEKERPQWLAPGEKERLVVQWHVEQLKVGVPDERVERLKEAPAWLRVSPEIYVAHGAILSQDPESAENLTGTNSYCDTSSDGRDLTLDTIQKLEGKTRPEVKVVVVGHTHVPTLGQASWEQKPRQWKWKANQDEAQAFNQADPLPLQNLENEPAILCPGSVGQPRLAGGDTRAAYAILDLERWAVWFRRVVYEERETEAAMVPMPGRLIEIILEG
jgi:predicted phosphodiesterase